MRCVKLPKIPGLILLWLALIASAAGQSKTAERSSEAGHWPPDENPRFFPDDVFRHIHVDSAGYYAWYLRSMSERPLAEHVNLERGSAELCVFCTTPRFVNWNYYFKNVVKQ